MDTSLYEQFLYIKQRKLEKFFMHQKLSIVKVKDKVIRGGLKKCYSKKKAQIIIMI